MPHYEHLQLVRLPEQLERRKRPSRGAPPVRDPGVHGDKLSTELDAAIDEQRQRRRPDCVDPALILRVRMSGMTMEDEWERLGLTVLATDDDKTLILFASDEDLRDFRERLGAYARGAPEGQRAPSYSGFIGRVDEIGAVEPRDRIGLRLRAAGFTSPDEFADDRRFVLDIELWEIGRRDLRTRKVEQIAELIGASGGELYDTYIGPTISMLRAALSGGVVRNLLNVEEVASIDLPPEPDLATGNALDLVLDDLPIVSPVPDDAPVVGVIDSGVNDHPLLVDVIVGAIGAPATLGTADGYGHGTRVSGVVVFGDLRGQLESETLTRAARIASAKVVNNEGGFDDRRLVASQMRESLTTLHERFGCRLFVVALGDGTSVFNGNKVGPWAATLDELARELDAVIVVSAGNRAPRSGNRLEQAITEYPGYLLEASNRLLEPAGAINVLTVGSLAHGEGLGPETEQDVHVLAITGALEPSPFTRIGPGVMGALKPDLVDIGGTLVFDAMAARLRRGEDLPTAGVLTLHHRYTDRLFTAGSGTSYAAPLVAHKAAQILTRFPRASANLVRALLVGAAFVPDEARGKLGPLGDDAVRNVCGHGRVDALRAAYSDEHRVVLYAEDHLAYDHFAVYHVPIPDPFQSGGRRTIRVTLAFDPPVRHTRADYTGVGMNFRLVRGCRADQIFEHFRRRDKADGDPPEIADRYNCALKPGPQERERGTVQSAEVTFSRGTESYGDSYFLVVRCESGWASSIETRQRFALVVELAHQAEVHLYERLRARLRVQP